MKDVEVTIRQVGQLRRLRKRRIRRALQDNLWLRRGEPTTEPQGGGLRRPALDLVTPSRRADDRVFVTRNEVLVADSRGADARDALVEQFGSQLGIAREQFEVQSVCRGIERVVTPGALPLAAALDHLAGTPLQTSANHVAMMGGTAKGGATPKSTTSAVETRAAAPSSTPDGPLVVLIDTGIDADAGDRSDGWVTFATPNDGAADVDPLDLLDPAGGMLKDGKLDLAAGHGTFVAGLVSQVAPEARVVALRAITTDGVCTEDSLVEAICRAAELFENEPEQRGVLNLSLGLESMNDEEPPLLRAALDVLPAEVVVVAAAGNAKTGVPLWPAASDRVCGVASLENAEIPSDWSNCGPWVDFSARGEGVISTFVVGEETAGTGADGDPFDLVPDVYEPPDPYAVWSGTSFATPQVAGMFARLLATTPTTTRAQAIQDLQAEGSWLKNYGYRLSVL